jgi:hypothetical protein
VAAALADLLKPQPFQRALGLCSRDAWKLRHSTVLGP